MNGWRECKLGDVLELVGGGTPKTTEETYWGGNIPWLSVADFNTGMKYVDKAEKTVTKKGVECSSTKILNAGDIIISARGTVGAMAVLKKPMAFNQSCYGIKEKPGVSDKEFLYYLVKNSINELQQISHGGVFDTITRETFDSIDILLPPLPVQKAIAGVLSSLDDKIELLHRQNKTLESLAETIFRQWFIEEAEKGWEEKPLFYFGKIICGKTPSKKKPEYFNGEVPFIKIPDMHNKTFVLNTEDKLSTEGKLSQINKTLPPFSICISCIATVGLVSMNAFESQTNQQINSIIPAKDYYRYYLYLFMHSFSDELKAMASGGTATMNLNTGNFAEISLLLPPEKVLFVFHDTTEPIFSKIFQNQIQINGLSEKRNLLISQLMSGDVEVDHEH